MAMYSAYFDESTSEKSPILVVAGFLSSDAQWSLLETEWKTVLAEYTLSAFHMQHFAQRSREFAGMDETTRKALLAKLLTIIARRVKVGFAAVVHAKEFEYVFTEEERKALGSPYTLACTACHLQVGQWAKANYQIEPVAYFFDAGHQHASEMAKNYLNLKNEPDNIEYRMGPLTLEHDNILLPLQAADIAAYELWRWLDEHYQDKTRHGRFPLSEIIKIEWLIREFDKGILEEIREHRRGITPTHRIVHVGIPAMPPGKVATPEEMKRKIIL